MTIKQLVKITFQAFSISFFFFLNIFEFHIQFPLLCQTLQWVQEYKISGTVITSTFNVDNYDQEELNYKLIIHLLKLTYSPG